MSVSEQDLETLEVWLDGELPDEQIEAFRQRLSAEPQLADAAARLRGDRDLRSRMWQTMEPSDSEVDSLVSQVRRGVRKEDLVTSRLRMFSRMTAVAASLAMVFMAGWISRSRLHIGEQPSAMAPMTVVSQTVPATPVGTQVQPAGPGMSRFASIPRNSNFATPVSNIPTPQPIDMSRISRLAPNYEVQVIDPITHEVKFQRELERLDDAMQFANYVARFQPASEPGRRSEPSMPLNIVPVNDTQKP